MSILQPGSNCMGIYRVKETGLLIDACDYYRAFYHAALSARHNILMAGWQFDSEVRLVRGAEARAADHDVRFLAFLEHLCQKKPELHIYILAWDFSVFFSLEREWFQDLIFNWSTNERIHFIFDGKHAVNATHHQKFVVIDGLLAFLGGIDICSDRWDDRRHLQVNPDRRNVDGIPYGAYHDIQSYHTGPLVRELVALFLDRWVYAGGEPIVLPTVSRPLPPVQGALPLPANAVAISRTQARDLLALKEQVHEIRRLFIDAIMAAECLIYLENQYFSSQAMYWALVTRMQVAERPRLDIVLILPDRLPFTEELFLGLPQNKMLDSLRQVAVENGHRLGIYSTVCNGNGERSMTFIHSKLLLVDDRFLTVGSANATNRSLGLDTELNVSWEAIGDGDAALAAAIRGVRVSLLAEHAALDEETVKERLQAPVGLVDYLNSLVANVESRLCLFQPDPAIEGLAWQGALQPVTRIVDPDRPQVEEFVFESLSRFETSKFTKGIMLLGQWLSCL